MQLTIDDFCKELAAKLLTARRSQLPYDNADMAAAMHDIAEEVLQAARMAFSRGERNLGDDLLRILDEIAPNPNTGAFDYFWSALRALQPSQAGVENPLLDSLRLKQAYSAAGSPRWPNAPEIWSRLVDNSAAHIIRHL